MAKKRKASSQHTALAGRTAPASNSKVRIDTYEDVADSEDEFHINRDKILLEEGPDAKRRRKWREQEEMLEASDSEVLAISSASEDEDSMEEDKEEQNMIPAKRNGYSGQESESDAEAAAEDEDLEGWGPSKKEYYGADVIETEQDARDEEEEALRLQKKHLQGMAEADFGFDEASWLDDGADGLNDAADEGDVITEKLPELHITQDMDASERLRLLNSRYPEFDPLAKEFLELQSLHHETAQAASAAESLLKRLPKTPIALIKNQALSAYLAAISMYFALLTTTAEANGSGPIAKNPQELRDHPVMDSLVKCRQLWMEVKGIRTPSITEELSNLPAIEEEPELNGLNITNGVESQAKLESNVQQKPKKSKAQRAAEAAQAEAQARRRERIRKMEEDLAALSSLTAKSAARKALKTKLTTAKPVIIAGDDSDIGDETELTAHEAAEKAKRKKSLRFYTSQIAQKANKRAAGRDAGGDADIPYRERLKDRQARLNAEAEKRGKKQDVAELGGESDEEDKRVAKELRGEDGTDEEDYYDMIASRSRQKKADKQAAAAAYAQAAREGAKVVEKEEVGPDGKRAITYAIEKNKGLTPFRKKEVRNPRVKKRLKYEDKKKKLASTRPVWKGGEGRGGYGGELTGIKKSLVKSVKL